MKRILRASLAITAVFLCFGTFSTAMALRIRNQNRQLEEQKERLEEQKSRLEEQKEQLEEQADEIRQQNESLLKEQALNLAEESLRLLEEGDRIGAIRTAIQSLTEYDGLELPYTALGEYALTESMHIYDSGSYIKPRYQMETEGIIRSMLLSPDRERLLTCDDTYTLILWDIATGSRITVRENCKNIRLDTGGYIFLDNDRFAYMNDAGEIVIYNWREEREEEFPDRGFPWSMAASGNLFAVEYGQEIQLYRADILEYLGNYPTENFGGIYGSIFINETGEIITFQEYAQEEGDSSDSRRIVFWNVKSGNTVKSEVGNGRLSAVSYAGNKAYVLCNYFSVSDFNYAEAELTAYNTDTGEILWTKTFTDCSGDEIFKPDREGADRFLVITSYDAWLVGMEDGQEYVRFSLGSNTAGGVVRFGEEIGDLYILYTRSGEYHTILAEKFTDYVSEGRFRSHSQNVKEFQACAGGYLVLPYQDNKVTLYTYSGNPEYEALETPIGESAGEYLDMTQAVDFAEENGLVMPTRANSVFYSGDGTLIYVCYNDNMLRIYDAATFELMSELELYSMYTRCELGVDDRGNRFVGGGIYGYMLSPDLKLLAVIENFVTVDCGQNRIIVKDNSGNQYGIPVYTVEELLDNARGYVLSCNYSESEGMISE